MRTKGHVSFYTVYVKTSGFLSLLVHTHREVCTSEDSEVGQSDNDTEKMQILYLRDLSDFREYEIQINLTSDRTSQDASLDAWNY